MNGPSSVTGALCDGFCCKPADGVSPGCKVGSPIASGGLSCGTTSSDKEPQETEASPATGVFDGDIVTTDWPFPDQRPDLMPKRDESLLARIVRVTRASWGMRK